AAKLAHDDDGAVIGQAALVQVVDEGADALVEDRKIFSFAEKDGVVGPALGVAAPVPVPIAVIERHDADAGFDEPAREEQALRHARGAVAVHEDGGVAGAVARDYARI